MSGMNPCERRQSYACLITFRRAWPHTQVQKHNNDGMTMNVCKMVKIHLHFRTAPISGVDCLLSINKPGDKMDCFVTSRLSCCEMIRSDYAQEAGEARSKGTRY